MGLSKGGSIDHSFKFTGQLTVLLQLILVALGYFAAVRLGLLFVVQPQGIALIWTPSGVALAALLLIHRRHWIWVLIVIFFTNMVGNLTGGNALIPSIGFGLANITEALLGAWVMERLSGPLISFTKVSDVIALGGVAAGCNAATAVLGAWVPHFFHGAPFFDTWFVWWTSDGLGMILITPAIVHWIKVTRIRFIPFALCRVLEGAGLFLGLTVLTWFATEHAETTVYPLFNNYIVFPLLMWAAFRFGMRGTTLGLIVFTMTAFWKVIDGHRISELMGSSAAGNLLSLQILIFIAALSSLTLAAVIIRQKAAEYALMESERSKSRQLSELNHLYETSPVGLCFLDTQLRFVRINKMMADINGKSIQEHIGKHIEEIIPEIAPKIMPIYDWVIKSGKPSLNFEIHSDGMKGAHHTKTWLVSYYPIKSKGGVVQGVSAVVQDITEKKRQEARLHKQRKMEALGTLAGGIAHDFNNLQSVILGNTELIMDDIPQLNPIHTNLEEIKTASLRAREVVSQLLHFSNKRDEPREPVKVGPVIRDALSSFQSSIKEEINIESHIPEFSDVVRADFTHIQQIVMNLCSNAVHAVLNNGGVIDVTLSVLKKEQLNHMLDLNEKKYVEIKVCDTGEGIEKADIDKIFDPYFTTREFGKGTGIGLSVVHGIVKCENGEITVESERGRGSIFRVYLPVVEKK